MRIGELAARSGVAATTIRYYEAVGLLPAPARSGGNQRAYAEADLNRLLLIKRLRLLGVGLPELRDLIDFTDANRCGPVREQLLPVVERRLTDLDRQLADLALLQAALRRYRDALRLGLAAPDALGERFACCDPATCACVGRDDA
ncbi:MAG: MerR family transcriptional regulator [Chloroflexota bacterium]|nr:MerR family transcriptional regulator [Chloroflexota bacterium]